MKLSTRYGLAGIAALAGLSLVHWLRKERYSGGEVSDYLLGVSPNFCAAIAISFMALSVWADQQKAIEYGATRRWFWFSAAFAGAGLLGWEIVQQKSANLVFDIHDIGATIAGLALSAAVFHLMTPRAPKQARR